MLWVPHDDEDAFEQRELGSLKAGVTIRAFHQPVGKVT